jgi:transcriptional regulator with XRE-family HTH domain
MKSGKAKFSSINIAFGFALYRLRTQREMKQDALADDAKLSRNYISMLELGERNPSLYTMLALCKGLGISLAELSQEVETQIQNFQNNHLDIE